MTIESACERCKYQDVPMGAYPCGACKFSFPPNSAEFETFASRFKPTDDAAEIDHPAHYAGKYECIDVMLDTMGPEDVKGFCLCNAFKYLWRCKKKHDTPTEDVKKAAWYLEKYLELGGDL